MVTLPSAQPATPAEPRATVPLLALAPLTLVLSGGTARADLAKLVLLGTLLAVFFLFAGKVWFPGGADQFMNYAEAIARGTVLTPNFAQRDAGYPLLMLLSGYPWLHSLIPVFLLQAGFAALMPLLVYESIHRLSPTAAFYAGLASAISLSPFLFMKMIHHDQSYIFFSVLMLCPLLIFVQTKRVRFLYLFTIAAMCASVTRPAGNALFPLFLIGGYIAVRGRALHYLACAAAFAALMAGYSWHRHVIFDLAHVHTTPSYTGAQAFYNPYVNTLDYGIRLSPTDVGPNFALALTTLRDRLQPSPKDSVFLRQHYLGSPAEEEFAAVNMAPFTPDQLIEQILARPNYEYYTLVCEANDDSALLQAALEIARVYPAMMLRYSARNLFHFIFEPGYSHTRYNFKPFSPVGLVFFPDQGPVAGDVSSLPAKAARELNFDSLWPRPALLDWLLTTVQELWLNLYRTEAAVLAYLMLATWAVAIIGLAGFDRLWSRRQNPIDRALVTSIVMTTLVFIYNAAVTAVFAEPDFRYREMVDLQAILIAGLGLVSIPYWLDVVLGRSIAAAIAERWDQAAQLTYACDVWRRLTAIELTMVVIGTAATGFVAWALFMVMNTNA
jgi:hypothetical protein